MRIQSLASLPLVMVVTLGSLALTACSGAPESSSDSESVNALTDDAKAKSYTLSCDDNDIFEAPLSIKITGATAVAQGTWSGPGDAIFEAHYTKLAAIDLVTSSKQALEDVTITQPVVAKTGPGFQLTLKARSNGSLGGHLTMVSTDSDKMTYSGSVVCKVAR